MSVFSLQNNLYDLGEDTSKNSVRDSCVSVCDSPRDLFPETKLGLVWVCVRFIVKVRFRVGVQGQTRVRERLF